MEVCIKVLMYLLLSLIIYFVIAVIDPIRAMYIYSIFSSYVYIAITQVLTYIIEVAIKLRGWWVL